MHLSPTDSYDDLRPKLSKLEKVQLIMDRLDTFPKDFQDTIQIFKDELDPIDSAASLYHEIVLETSYFLVKDLNKYKHSIDEVRNLIQSIPEALTVRYEGTQKCRGKMKRISFLPIEVMLNHDKELDLKDPFTVVLAEEGDKYDVGGKGTKGGLLMPNKQNYRSGTLYSELCTCEFESEKRILKITQDLVKSGLFKPQDVKEHNLLDSPFTWGNYSVFHFLVDFENGSESLLRAWFTDECHKGKFNFTDWRHDYYEHKHVLRALARNAADKLIHAFLHYSKGYVEDEDNDEPTLDEKTLKELWGIFPSSVCIENPDWISELNLKTNMYPFMESTVSEVQVPGLDLSLTYFLLRNNVNLSSIFSTDQEDAIVRDDARVRKRSEEVMKKRILYLHYVVTSRNPLNFACSILKRPLTLLSLPKEFIHNIFSFLAKDNALIKHYINYGALFKDYGIRALFKDYSLVSKEFQRLIITYIKETPLVIGNDHIIGKYRTLLWACENKLKIGRCNIFANGPNSATIAMYLLNNCDLSEVKFLRIYAAHCHYNQDYDVFDLAYSDGIPYGSFGTKLASIASLQSRIGDISWHMQNLKSLEIVSTRDEFDFEMLKCFQKYCPMIENLSVVFAVKIERGNEILGTNNSVDELGEIICQFPNLKRLRLNSDYGSDSTGFIIKSETLEEIDLSEGSLSMNECICPRLKVIKCKLDRVRSYLDFSGVTATATFIKEQIKVLQRQNAVNINAHDHLHEILGLQVPDHCVLEIHRGLWV